MNATEEVPVARRLPGRAEVLLLALVLVAAFHAVPSWTLRFLPAQQWYDRLGRDGFNNLYDVLSLVLPLVLCLGTPSRSGFRIGVWQGRTAKVLGICALPIALAAGIYPLTSQPFRGDPIGAWLISPAAQELLFAGYLYGLIDTVFPGVVHDRLRIRKAVVLTALFFAMWHVPNFSGIQTSYVLFQLMYTFVGGAWALLARQLTGSLLPGIGVHMAVNFIAVTGW